MAIESYEEYMAFMDADYKAVMEQRRLARERYRQQLPDGPRKVFRWSGKMDGGEHRLCGGLIEARTLVEAQTILADDYFQSPQEFRFHSVVWREGDSLEVIGHGYLQEVEESSG